MNTEKAVYRIIDANFNRTREGLRVCEDIMRFFVSSRELAARLKALRHGISGIMAASPGLAGVLIHARDSAADIGRKPRQDIEIARSGAPDIFTANIERVKESIRVLEEFFKIIDQRASNRLSGYRFEAYDIEKKAYKKFDALRRAQ